MVFIAQTIDRISHPTAAKFAQLFKIIKMIAVRIIRPEERMNLQNHFEALKVGRYALDMRTTGPDIKAINAQIKDDRKDLKSKQFTINARPSVWNLYGLLGAPTWTSDGDSTPYLSEVKQFDEIILSK